MSETIVKIENLHKSFTISSESSKTLKESFLNLFHSKSYKDFYALDGINLKINRGDFVGIIGKNGSGKSTLLKMISSIYIPDDGNIDVKGKIVPFLELGVGFNPELTGRENIYLNGVILGLTKKEIDEHFDQIVEFSEIEAFLDTPVKNYSSGMYLRLAFSIAIQVSADIYILDEVLAVGDAAFQKKCVDRLTVLKDEGATIIYVSHAMDTVVDFCTRAIYMKGGKIIADGKPKKIVKQYMDETT